MKSKREERPRCLLAGIAVLKARFDDSPDQTLGQSENSQWPGGAARRLGEWLGKRDR
jgi:hypothetical protein